VLVDTPPMLEIPDARIIGRVTDTTILVVRAGATTRTAVSAASQRLSDDGVDLLGAIVNDWNPANSSAGYYGYSPKYYGS
jgi:Mrp family chromosome partitioning ATPase